MERSEAKPTDRIETETRGRANLRKRIGDNVSTPNGLNVFMTMPRLNRTQQHGGAFF